MTDFYNLFFLKAFPGAGSVLGLFVVILALSGCVSTPVAPDVPETFVLSGKVGVREAGENFSANLLWHQRGEAFEIDLWGPLGQGRVKLVKHDDQIQLRSDQGVLAEGDAETVMRQQLGWSLPVDVLPAWVQGQPLADAPAQEISRDDLGRITGFEQLGWKVVLERYEQVANEFEQRHLPRRVTATRAEGRVRLVVSEWRI